MPERLTEGLIPTIWAAVAAAVAWLFANVIFHGRAIARIDQKLDDLKESIDRMRRACNEEPEP